MKKKIFSLALILVAYSISYGQGVGIGTTTPDASALLDLSTTNKGFLPPRMTAAQKILIPSPKAGLLIYQTDGTAGLYIYNGSAWEAAANSGPAVNSWSTNGNAGTLPASNFIGTTDNTPLKFRVNNFPAGELNNVNGNMAFGVYALASNTTGSENTAVGYNSLNKNLTGHSNTAIGLATLFSNTYGTNNTALGQSALVSNTIGSDNVATGFYSLYNNLTGNSNVAVGYRALHENASGFSNIAIGKDALYSNTKISNLVAIGDSALFNNGTNATQSFHGTANTALGSKALYANTTGSGNTAQGYQSLYENTTGGQNTAVGYNSLNNNVSGNDNTAVGLAALFNNTIGSQNTALGTSLVSNTKGNENVSTGYYALYNNLTGNDNVANGYFALYFNSSGNSNVAVGSKSLFNNTTGSDNSGFGANTSVAANNLNNATAVGAYAEVACSNCLVLGSVNGENSGTSNVKVGIGITAPIADLHIKQSKETYPVNGGGIRLERVTNTNHWDLATDNTDDLDFTYNGFSRGYINHTTGVFTATSDIRMKKDILLIGAILPRIMQLQPKTYHYIDNKSEDLLSYGFMAQEVEKVFPDFVTTKGADGLKAIAYQNFTVIAVKAIQEQQQQLETLKNENKILQERIEKLEAAVEAMIQSKKTN